MPAGTMDAARITIPDRGLAAICQKAAHPDPAQRYPDAGVLAEALKRWLAPVILIPAVHQRQPSSHRPKPAALSGPSSRPSRLLLANCAVIALLLFAIHAMWGVYQEKKESLAHLQRIEEAKPRAIVVKQEPTGETARGIDPMIVQLD